MAEGYANVRCLGAEICLIICRIYDYPNQTRIREDDTDLYSYNMEAIQEYTVMSSVKLQTL